MNVPVFVEQFDHLKLLDIIFVFEEIISVLYTHIFFWLHLYLSFEITDGLKNSLLYFLNVQGGFLCRSNIVVWRKPNVTSSSV